MKTIHRPFLLPAWPALADAHSYSMGWSTIDGGGGTITGGPTIGVNCSVSGTIGQPDAGGALSGGNFSLTGGFWALSAVQTPGGATPDDRPHHDQHDCRLLALAFPWIRLTHGLGAVNWSNAPGPIQDDNTTKTLIVNEPRSVQKANSYQFSWAAPGSSTLRSAVPKTRSTCRRTTPAKADCSPWRVKRSNNSKS